jgi:hypothetical protein
VVLESGLGGPQLKLNFGYVNSKWNKFNNGLKNGSLLFEVAGAREYVPGLEGGIAFGMIQQAANGTSSENIYAYHVNFSARYYLLSERVRPYAGLGVAFGAYRVWTLVAETQRAISYTKLGSGTLVGAVPSLGVRLNLTRYTSFDLGVNYFGFLDNPAYRVGGWAAVIGFGIGRN